MGGLALRFPVAALGRLRPWLEQLIADDIAGEIRAAAQGGDDYSLRDAQVASWRVGDSAIDLLRAARRRPTCNTTTILVTVIEGEPFSVSGGSLARAAASCGRALDCYDPESGQLESVAEIAGRIVDAWVRAASPPIWKRYRARPELIREMTLVIEQEAA